MANIFDVYKTFRPNTVILSDDFNSFQNALVASFNKLGTEAPSGLLGVSTPFAVGGTPTDPLHAVSKSWYEGSVDALVSGTLASEQAAALASANAAAASAAAAEVTRQATDAIRFEDAYYMTFFFGQSK